MCECDGCVKHGIFMCVCVMVSVCISWCFCVCLGSLHEVYMSVCVCVCVCVCVHCHGHHCRNSRRRTSLRPEPRPRADQPQNVPPAVAHDTHVEDGAKGLRAFQKLPLQVARRRSGNGLGAGDLEARKIHSGRRVCVELAERRVHADGSFKSLPPMLNRIVPRAQQPARARSS